nr:putative integron gene cassette protein [uncultured bacterium]
MKTIATVLVIVLTACGLVAASSPLLGTFLMQLSALTLDCAMAGISPLSCKLARAFLNFWWLLIVPVALIIATLLVRYLIRVSRNSEHP